MLKKLLASALAVATVASCAYVPSALASADTTYVTANLADYLEWSLKNPGAKDTVDISIYVSGSGVTKAGAYSMSVKPEDNTVEYVQAHLAGATLTAVDPADDRTKTKDYNYWNDDLTLSWQMNNSVRYVIKYAAAAGANNYVVNVAKERAVVYHPFDMWNLTGDAAVATNAVADTNSWTLDAKGLKLLGYYEEGTAENAVLTELTQAKYINEAKVAGYKFLYWKFAANDGGNNASYATPVYESINDPDNAREYTAVELVGYKNTNGNILNYRTPEEKAAASALKDRLTTGLYAVGTYAANEQAAYTPNTIYLPNSESAYWTQSLINLMKADYRGNYIYPDTWNVKFQNSATTTDVTTYKPVSVRQVVRADSANGIKAKYAIVYDTDAASNKKYVNYTLKYRIVDSKIDGIAKNGIDQGTVPTFIDGTGDYEWETVGTEYYTTDPEEIYNKFKGNTHPATLAEYLDKAAGDDANFVWNGAYCEITRDAADTSVTVTIDVVRYNKYEVYSFGPDNSVAKTTAFLSKDDVSKVSYTSKDLNDKFAPASVIKASAAKLGASETATIKDVPATYAYSDVVVPFVPDDTTANAAAVSVGMIYSTYKMGDATVEVADFATSTGAFDAEAYFGRAAKAGDVVTLKVSLSDQGDTKKFELKNVTVKYDVIGATKGETFEYATKYTNDYKNGVATEFVLAEGANIITGTVTYNGKTVTLAPFYAYVG